MSTSIDYPNPTDYAASVAEFEESPLRQLSFLLAAQDADLRLRGEELTEARRALETLARVHSAESLSTRYDVLEATTGATAVVRRFRAVVELAQNTCLIAVPAVFARAVGFDVLAEAHEVFAAKGVVLRQLLPTDLQHDTDLRQFVATSPLAGQIRLRAQVPVFTMIVDRSRLILSTDPLDPDAGVIESGQPGLLESLTSLLEEQWSSARRWDEGPMGDSLPLSEQERELLTLLASGRTDEQAGRRLRVSIRTVRRIYSDVARRMAIRSRFEAGVVAARNGWV